MIKKVTTGLMLGLAALALNACLSEVELDEQDAVETSRSEIRSGSTALSFEARRAAQMQTSGGGAYCTGTLIAPNWVLTAAHCNPAVSHRAVLYAGNTTPTVVRTADLVRRQGCVASGSNWTNCSGQFADIALVRLTANAPSSATVATMAWTYPGNWANILEVGAGNHDNASNATGLLKRHTDVTYSAAPNIGHFLTEGVWTDPGDSGGPAYLGTRVLGVLYGYTWEWAYRGLYSNVPFHLDWILRQIGYLSPFDTYPGWRLTSTTNRIASWSSVASGRACAYACNNTSSCSAYSFVGATCDLYSANNFAYQAVPGAELGLL